MSTPEVTASAPNPAPMPSEPRTSGLAIASLVLGILGFLVIPALAGLICGIVAMIQINRSAGQLKGQGIAIAGTVLSGIMTLLIPVIAILAAMLLPALAKAKSKAQTIHGTNNAKQLCLAMHLYAGDSKEVLPRSENWCDAIRPYTGGNNAVFHRAQDHTEAGAQTTSYAFNARLDGAKLSGINPQTVLIFESTSHAWNASGGPDLLRRPGNRGDAVIVGFADGHSEAVTGPRLDTLRWEP